MSWASCSRCCRTARFASEFYLNGDGLAFPLVLESQSEGPAACHSPRTEATC